MDHRCLTQGSFTFSLCLQFSALRSPSFHLSNLFSFVSVSCLSPLLLPLSMIHFSRACVYSLSLSLHAVSDGVIPAVFRWQIPLSCGGPPPNDNCKQRNASFPAFFSASFSSLLQSKYALLTKGFGTSQSKGQSKEGEELGGRI